ncbi:MAG: hypothetical protein LWW85_07465, partial [Marinilabiliales bacterium]|nr:hypothetical protein [Marinilabiliales bacterium]
MNKTILLLFLSLAGCLKLAAQEQDSINNPTLANRNLRELKNNWSTANNPASHLLDCVENSSAAHYNLEQGSGAAHRIMEPDSVTHHNLVTESYRTLGRIRLMGKFAYASNREKGGRWNGTMDPYRGNPYIIGDSVRSALFKKESYQLSGTVALPLNGNWLGGIELNGAFAVAARERDPRPLSTLSKVSIHPGIILRKRHLDVGLDLGYQLRREEISYLQHVVDNPDIAYFAFRGFGFYNKELGQNYDRTQTEHLFSAGLQLGTRSITTPYLAEARFQYSFEGIQDGAAYVSLMNGGDWETVALTVNQSLSRRESGRIQRFSLGLDYQDGFGSEIYQTKERVGTMTLYVTNRKTLRMDRNLHKALLRYELISLSGKETPVWHLNAGLQYFDNGESYYVVPETLSSGYQMAHAFLGLERNFRIGSLEIAPSAFIDYGKEIERHLNLSDDPSITERQ